LGPDEVEALFRSPLRKVSGIVVGSADPQKETVVGLGTLSSEPSPDSLRWEIGSITKVFTGLLLADMVCRGEVSLDDPLGAYLSGSVEVSLPDEAFQPTLGDLSSHVSGLPGIPKEWYGRLRRNEDPYASIVAEDMYSALGPESVRPGKPRFRYSNFGVGLLGLLLGNAVGRHYEDLVSERLLRPFGMADTGFGSLGVVQGYRRNKPTPPWTFDAMAPAGAIRSTASDMLKFASAVIEPPSRLGEALALASERRFEIKSGRAYAGLGWQLRARQVAGDGWNLWHNGGTYGTASFLAINRGLRIAVVSFGNRGPGLFGSPLDRSSWKLFDAMADAWPAHHGHV